MIVLARTHEPVEELGLFFVSPMLGTLAAVKAVNNGVFSIAAAFLHGELLLGAVNELALERHSRGCLAGERRRRGRAAVLWMGMVRMGVCMWVVGVNGRWGRGDTVVAGALGVVS